MEKIEPPDIHYLRAARGWVGLRDWISANDELLQITPRLRNHPAVLLLRCDILNQAEQWNELLVVATKMLQLLPEKEYGLLDCSYALNQLKRTQEAYDLLRPAAEKFPKNGEVTYNLACYSARLGRLQEARHWLEKTAALEDVKALKLEALADPDLKPLWPVIARIPTNPPPLPVNSTPRWPARFALLP